MGALTMAAGAPAGSYRFVFRQLAPSGLFPIVAGAERLCDRITAFSALPGRAVAAEDEAALRQFALYVAATPRVWTAQTRHA